MPRWLDHLEGQVFISVSCGQEKMRVELVWLLGGNCALQPVMVTGRRRQRQNFDLSARTFNGNNRLEPIGMIMQGQPHPFACWRIHDLQKALCEGALDAEGLRGVVMPVAVRRMIGPSFRLGISS